MPGRLLPQRDSYAFLSGLRLSRTRTPPHDAKPYESSSDHHELEARGQSDSTHGHTDTTENTEHKSQPTVDEELARLPSGELTDEDRLRMLGYEVKLGRPFGFWASAGMNICHLSFVYDFVRYIGVFAHEGPLLFVIGFPFIAFFHLCIIGPFAELTSAYPVAGAMATWAWQCARNGVGGERQWGWVVSGLTLAMHLGKTIAYIAGVTTTLVVIYYSADPSIETVEVENVGFVALDPKAWWEPVFYAALVALVAFVVCTRVARTSMFWILAGSFNIAFMGMIWVVLVAGVVKLKTSPTLIQQTRDRGPMNWGFPRKAEFPFNLSRMIFMGLPLTVMPVDCSIHMAEETRNPARTVPRVLWTTCAFHYINVYITVVLYICVFIPWTGGNHLMSPFVPMGMALGSDEIIPAVLGLVTALACTTQIIAAMVATSRFIFALARDRGIPFSRYLVMTDKRKEPWVAMAVLIVCLFLSTTAWLINRDHFYGLLQAFSYPLINLPYAIPLILYLFSRLDLVHVGRTEFSIGKLSRPSACIAILYLLLGIIQNCLPATEFNGNISYMDGDASRTVTSYLPIIVGAMLLVMLVSWFLYGRRNYVGPIRALTIWATGQDVDPANMDANNPRARIIQELMDKKVGRGSTSGNRRESSSQHHSGGSTSTPRTPRSPLSPGIPLTPRRAAIQRILGRGGAPPISPPESATSSYGQQTISIKLDSGPGVQGASVLPESGIFPESVHGGRSLATTADAHGHAYRSQGETSAAQGESQLLPTESRVNNYASHSRSVGASSVQIESQVLPTESRVNNYQTGSTSFASHSRSVGTSSVQIESQLLPDEPEPSLRPAGRQKVHPPPAINTRNTRHQAYQLMQMSSRPPLSPPPPTPRTALPPPPRPRHSLRGSRPSTGELEPFEAAQEESQLEPLPDPVVNHSVVSFRDQAQAQPQ